MLSARTSLDRADGRALQAVRRQRVVVYKTHSVNDYLGPLLRRGLRPLGEAGSCASSTAASEGAYLCAHTASISITRVYDASSSYGGRRRRKAGAAAARQGDLRRARQRGPGDRGAGALGRPSSLPRRERRHHAANNGAQHNAARAGAARRSAAGVLSCAASRTVPPRRAPAPPGARGLLAAHHGRSLRRAARTRGAGAPPGSTRRRPGHRLSHQSFCSFFATVDLPGRSAAN